MLNLSRIPPTYTLQSPAHVFTTGLTKSRAMGLRALVAAFCILTLALGGLAEQCGRQAGGRVCPGGACCSKYGWCGNTADYCGSGCQSQCGSSGDVGKLITRSMFNNMLKHRNEGSCPGKGFYTYDAFIAAAKAFPGFGTTGDTTTRKREIAAFLAQTSHETTG